ncbi:hypothetical protein [Pseudarthrobacter sp. NIBRBAC000502770]|uniref:hypothetical protein n=1 Tax=Pseudarthrobacter sp. NIBRBAC000502770 TaxID=2590785 RepID=UPI00114070AE|nr:hypothetical protein [Pseudarthrobacter sp. NIBRBAC000502770]
MKVVMGDDSSPQYARAQKATENVWREMAAEFGLLTETELSAVLAVPSAGPQFALDEMPARRLLAIERPEGLRYPGFQVDRQRHAIRPVMQDLLKVARGAGRSGASLALWMVSATGYLDGARPVDLLESPAAVIDAAIQSFNVEW